VKFLDKDKIVNALNAIQSGSDSGNFYDELEMSIGVLMKVSEALIAEVWQEIHEDDDLNN
jgi:hypothetical protein